MTRVPGVGAKTARLLFDELGVASLEDLKDGGGGGKGARGEGPRRRRPRRTSWRRWSASASRARAPAGCCSPRCAPIAEELAAALREHPAANRVEVAGSARRWAETCKDIDLIATAEEPAALAEHLAGHELIAAAGQARPQRRAGADPQRDLGRPADRRRREAFGNLLQHFTGSAAHNVQLREEAVARGLSVSEHGITETESGETTLCASEEEVYERLGYAYIEPELREGRGELKAAREGKLPDLVAVEDIRGDLHSHTTLSDGRNTLEEMAAAGRERGYAYMAITDHSASHGFGDHVTAERLWQRIEEVARVEQGQARLPPARRLGGQHRPRRRARLPRRPARRARLGGGQRPHLLLDLRAGDDRARPGGDREPATSTASATSPAA